jgi:hypothetical protein
MVPPQDKKFPIVSKSRVRWLKEEETDTIDFHTCVRKKGRRNSILALWVGDR